MGKGGSGSPSEKGGAAFIALIILLILPVIWQIWSFRKEYSA